MKPCLRFAWIFAFLVVGPATGADYDLVIRGGKVVDGTGNPWFHGDLAIRGDKIVAVGRIPAGAATREIDARGLVVAPGFIDIHSHSDFLLLEDGNAPSKVRQGVVFSSQAFGLRRTPISGFNIFVKEPNPTEVFPKYAVAVVVLGLV